MKKHENTPTPANDERELRINHLTSIRGINRKTAEALYTMGVHSFDDLALYLKQHTTKEISDELKQYGSNLPAGFIKKDGWIQQIEKLSSTGSPSPVSHEQKEEVQQTSKGIPPDLDPQHHDAVFTVLFDIKRTENGKAQLQTTVYDEKNGGKVKLFEEGDGPQWVNWMFEKAGWTLSVTQIETKTSEGTAVTPNANIEINSFRVYATTPPVYTSEKKLTAEVIFTLSGSDAEMLADQRLPYTVDILTVEPDHDAHTIVASDIDDLQPKLYEYTRRLEFKMPEVGRYELFAFVRLPICSELRGSHQGLTIRIIP